MAIARIGGQAQITSTTSIALAQPAPTLTTTEPVLRAVSLFWATATTLTPPAGWTTVLAPTSATSGQVAVYYRWHQAADASFTWTAASAAQGVLRCINLSGVDPVTPIDATPVTSQQTTSSTTWSNVPIITTASANAFAWWWLIAGSTTTTSQTFALGAGAWTSETQAPTATTGYMGLGGWETRAAAGSTGTRSATYSLSTTYRGVVTSFRAAPEPGRRLLLAA